MNLAVAMRIAANAHEQQRDKGGHPYILHPMRIVINLSRIPNVDEETLQIGAMHDAIEDGSVTFDQLREMGFNDVVINGVRAVTHFPGDSYDQYIDKMRGNIRALLVKREDLRDNSDITRLKGLRDKDFDRMKKYAKAYAKVEEYIKECLEDVKTI